MGNASVWTARHQPDSRLDGRSDLVAARPVRLAPTMRRLAQAAVLIAGALTTAAFAAMALLPAFGMRTMIVLSGSMAPIFEAGDAVVVAAAEPDEVQAGDVITFTGYGTEHLTTHRVLERHHVDGKLHFRTQGDANPDPDPNLAPAGGVQGTVRWVLPHTGRILAVLAGSWGKLALLGAPALLLIVAQLRNLCAEARSLPAARHRSGVALAGGAAIVASAVATAALMQTMASFAGVHEAGGNTFQTSSSFGG